ncbi:sulfatase [Aeoliella mucimassa]|uniref:Arylsulfatase n=1 Tax=Aeoliella mucimassa TaxID=2527972 RepID=A0A518AN02_9BACT|nr:sulfatase [Aeoliella mucimassa]QDU56098.1 Arylsulfatase [Aeoliella mucimassa]
MRTIIYRPFCVMLLGSLMAAAVLAAGQQAVAAPNVILFLVDDMGIMDTSLPFLTDEQGNAVRHPLNDYYRTPNMERLAQQGVRLNNFYAMSVCSPTRASIMTGQNASRHHTTNWINPQSNNRGPFGPADWNWTGLKKSDVTLPRLLEQAGGYRTIHVGKGHFGPANHEGAEPLNLGFDVNIAGHAAGHPASYYGTDNFGEKNPVQAVPGLEKYHGQEIFLTEALTREAKQQVTEAVEAKQPFYLYMAHYAVHAPFQSDPRFADHYRDSGKKPQAQAFATLIEGMDKSLGDLLDHVESLGVAEETIVIFLGDNGSDAPLGGAHEIASAAPLRGKKGSHYEGGVRVPMIAGWAKSNPANPVQAAVPIAEGQIQSQVASVCDLLPTILSIAELDNPANHPVDGFALQPLLAGKHDDSRPETFLMHYPHSVHRSNYFTIYRHGDWKIAYHYLPKTNPQNKRYELFNLAEDPTESNDLSSSEPEQLARMMGEMIEQLAATGAQYPTSRDRARTLAPQMPNKRETN